MHGGSGLGGSWRRGQFDIDEDQTKIYDSKVILRLLSYVMRRRGTALLTLSFMLIYTAVTILIPLVLRESINRYVLNGDTQGLNTAVAIFFALVLVNYISNSSHLWLLAKMGQDVLYDLRSEIFTHLQKLSQLGAGLLILESTFPTEDARISKRDLVLSNDDHLKSYTKLIIVYVIR